MPLLLLRVLNRGVCSTNTDLQIRPRPGLALKYGITVLNAPGTIDPDYRDEIKVLLINLQGDGFDVVNVGNYEIFNVSSSIGGTLTFASNKTKYYGDGASNDLNI